MSTRAAAAVAAADPPLVPASQAGVGGHGRPGAGRGRARGPAAGAPAAAAGGNAALGRQLAAAYGWGGGPQWACLDALWARESGWSATATNPQSGAYGIPQSLPPGKMPAAALPPVSSASAQIGWGLSYIAGRYGTPCGAWSHETADGWY